MNTYPICDYITIFSAITDIDVSPITLLRVPQASYSSNAKSDYCLVSLADASFDVSSIDEPVAVCLVSPSAQNNQSDNVVLGNLAITATSGSTIYHHQFTPNGVKYLIPARPSEIRLRGLTTQTKADLALTLGYCTLKFEYLSKEQVDALNSQSNYTTF